jgi:hypothetical protein
MVAIFDVEGWTDSGAHGVALTPMRWLLCAALLASGPSVGAPKKPKKTPVPASKPAPCPNFSACVAELNDAFEAGDFEGAQRLASRAESLASGPKEAARILVLRGALDYQAAPGAEVGDAVRTKFAEALRLDPELSVVAIPAYARTDALEALFLAARPKVEAPAAAPEQPPPPPPVLLTQPAPEPRRFPVVATILGGVAVASASVGLGLRVHANAEYASAQGASVFDDDRLRLVESARTNGAASTGLWIGAATTLALALVFLLLER